MDILKGLRSFPKFLSGIEKIHKDFYKAWLEARNYFNKYIETYPASNAGLLYIDFSKQDETDILEGNFIINNKIFRPYKLRLEYPLFFPVVNYGQNVKYKGIECSIIDRFKHEKKEVVIAFRFLLTSGIRVCQFTKIDVCDVRNRLDIVDDIGLPYNNFNDIFQLKISKIPNDLLCRPYSLAGLKYYAPYTSEKDVYCVLYAQSDNKFDANAVKVLRWIPSMKKSKEMYQGDYFFELGYISRNQNDKLHHFMVNEDSKILFARKCNNDISLIGGVDLFFNQDLNFPKCLYNIHII